MEIRNLFLDKTAELRREKQPNIRQLYIKLNDMHPEHPEVIFAFSQEQLNEGIKKIRKHSDEKIYSATAGMYGTKAGIEYFSKFYDDKDEAIKTLCDPQTVYLYECDNHEFAINREDTEALDIVFRIFGEEGLKKIKRKRGAWSNDTEAAKILNL